VLCVIRQQSTRTCKYGNTVYTQCIRVYVSMLCIILQHSIYITRMLCIRSNHFFFPRSRAPLLHHLSSSVCVYIYSVAQRFSRGSAFTYHPPTSSLSSRLVSVFERERERERVRVRERDRERKRGHVPPSYIISEFAPAQCWILFSWPILRLLSQMLVFCTR